MNEIGKNIGENSSDYAPSLENQRETLLNNIGEKAPIHYSHQNYGKMTGMTVALEAPLADMLELAVSFWKKSPGNGTNKTSTLSVTLQMGTSRVNPGNQAEFRRLKALLKGQKAKTDVLIDIPNQDGLYDGLDAERLLHDKIDRARPDRYDRKVGAEKARGNIKEVRAELKLAVSNSKGTTYTLEAPYQGGSGIQTLNIFVVHGSRHGYMVHAQDNGRKHENM